MIAHYCLILEAGGWLEIIRLINRETDKLLQTFLSLLSDGEGHHAPIGGNEPRPSNMFQVENLSPKNQSLKG